MCNANISMGELFWVFIFLQYLQYILNQVYTVLIEDLIFTVVVAEKIKINQQCPLD